MKKRKGSLLQRMMAVLLAAVLVIGMVLNAAPVTVLAQERNGVASVGGNDGELTEEETEPAPQANNIASGNGWVLDADGKLTISSDEGMAGWENYMRGDYEYYTRQVVNVEIQDGVTSLGNNAFYNYGELTGITIADSVTSIGEKAFIYCDNLNEVIIKSETPPTLGDGVFTDCGFVKDNTQSIHVPEGKAQAYKTAWTDWAAYIADGTHTHSWLSDWTSNETHHWHECTVSDCPITGNADKDGYGAHIYDNDSDTDCNTCGYERTAAATEIVGIEVSCDLANARAAQIGDNLVYPVASVTLNPATASYAAPSWWKKEDSGFTVYKGNTWEEGAYVREVEVIIYEGYIFAAELQITSPTGENWTVVKRSDDNRIIVLRSDEIVKTARPHTHDLTLTPAKDATCTEDGNTAYYVCGGNDGCGKWFSDAEGTQEITNHDSVVIFKTGHSYDESAWGYTGADGHAHKCRNCNAHSIVQAHTPGAAATETTPQTCTVCGYELSPAIGHTHNYGDWQHDSIQHWKVCSCGDETGRGNHDFEDWITDREATATETGTKHRECQTCGYTETGSIPATGESHTHNYGDWQHDSTQHWKVCSCGDETDRGNHNFGDWVTDKEATATETGTRHRECQTCGCRQTEPIPAAGTDPGSGTVIPDVKPGENTPETNASAPTEELTDSGSADGIQSENPAPSKPYDPATAETRVKSEQQGNIYKEVSIKAEDTFDTVIATQIPELANIVLTEAEKQQAAGGTNIKIVLEVQDAQNMVSSEDKALVEAVLNSPGMSGFAVGQYLDISLFKIIGESRDAIHESDGKITITIAVPDSLKNTDNNKTRVFAVIRVHGGQAELLADLDSDEDTITIETDRFSPYAIVYKDMQGGTKNSGTKDKEPKTGDAEPVELFATLSMVAGVSYLLLYFTERGHGMSEETKKEFVSRLVRWAKRGGKIRKLIALLAIFALLVYYHSIGKNVGSEKWENEELEICGLKRGL